MPDPYNYYTPQQSPFEYGLKAFEMGQLHRANAMAIEQQKQAIAAEEQKRIRQAEYQQALVQLAQNPNATAQDYIRLQGMYPEKADAIKEINQQRSDVQLQGDLNIMQKVNTALAAGKNDQAIEYLRIYSSALKNSGREDQAQSIDNIAEMAKDHPEAVKAELYQQLLANWGPEKFAEYFEQQQKATTDKQAYAVKSEIYPDGTSLQVMSVGPPVITAPDGRQLKGEEAAKAIRRAQDYGSKLAKNINYNRSKGALEGQKELKAEITAEVKAAELAIKKSEEFGKKADLAGERILKIDNAINIAKQAISEGKSLGRGWFEGKLPKMNKYPALMQQAAYDLGLGVVQATTFGALSKGELDTAMKTALPELADDKDTVEWLKKRKDAEEKIQRELNRAAIYLGKPGNTVTMWRKLQQDIRSGKITPEEAYGEVEPKQQTTELINQPQQTEGQSRKTRLFNRLMQIQQSKGQ